MQHTQALKLLHHYALALSSIIQSIIFSYLKKKKSEVMEFIRSMIWKFLNFLILPGFPSSAKKKNMDI